MFQELKSRILKKRLASIIILGVLGIICIALFTPKQLAKMNRKNIYYAKANEIAKTKEAKIEIDKYNLYGIFSVEEDSKRTKAYYCLVLIGDDEPAFMAVKVDSKYESKLDKISDEYTDLDNGIDSDERTVIKAEGTISRMSSEELRYFSQYIDQFEFDLDEYGIETCEYCLDGTKNDSSLFFIFLGIILVVIAVIMLILGLSGSGVKKLEKQLEETGMKYAVEMDYASAVTMGKSRNMMVGNRFSYYIRGFKVDIIENDKIVWTYTKRIKHRTNGIPTGSTYSVLIYTIDKKKKEIAFRNEAECNEVVDTYGRISQRIILGYTDELMTMYNRDFERFLSISYNNPAYGNNQNSMPDAFANNSQNNGYNPYGNNQNSMPDAFANNSQNNGYNPYGNNQNSMPDAFANNSQNNGYNPYGNNQNSMSDSSFGNNNQNTGYNTYGDNTKGDSYDPF